VSAIADPRAWALEILGFPAGTVKPSKREITAQFRERLRTVHPDHGGSDATASRAIADLAEARRVLTKSL
jgi:curved DNA-binding protein CbpA